jgi:hypothetical protein
MMANLSLNERGGVMLMAKRMRHPSIVKTRPDGVNRQRRRATEYSIQQQPTPIFTVNTRLEWGLSLDACGKFRGRIWSNKSSTAAAAGIAHPKIAAWQEGNHVENTTGSLHLVMQLWKIQWWDLEQRFQ